MNFLSVAQNVQILFGAAILLSAVSDTKQWALNEATASLPAASALFQGVKEQTHRVGHG